MVPEYLRSVVLILDRGQKSNSYKFALLRALADTGKFDVSSVSVGIDWLAERFLTYYWPLTIEFRVRQSPDLARDPVIMRFIRQEVAELKLSPGTSFQDYKKLHATRYTELLSRCCKNRGCFDDVLPRFHKLRGGREVLYPLYRRSRDVIQLQDGALEFLRAYHRTINLLSIGAWVQFTEQFTFAPRLYEKIGGIAPERKHEKYRSTLAAIHGTTCFYCGRVSANSMHVDHFVPWSFVLEDRIWNLVFACHECNCLKSDKTPGDPFVEKLNRRNRRIISEFRDSDTNSAAYRDLREFTPEKLEVQIGTLIGNCRADGFGIWESTVTT